VVGVVGGLVVLAPLEQPAAIRVSRAPMSNAIRVRLLRSFIGNPLQTKESDVHGW
jgi:hypothetical protein